MDSKYRKKVRVETSAASAICCTVVPEKPCSWKSRDAAPCSAIRVSRFLRSRRPSSNSAVFTTPISARAAISETVGYPSLGRRNPGRTFLAERPIQIAELVVRTDYELGAAASSTILHGTSAFSSM